MFLPPAHWALGISSVRFGPFLLGTVLGLAPLIVILTWIGAGMMEWTFEQPPELWWSMVAGVLAIGVAYGFVAKRRRRRNAELPAPEAGSTDRA